MTDLYPMIALITYSAKQAFLYHIAAIYETVQEGILGNLSIT